MVRKTLRQRSYVIGYFGRALVTVRNTQTPAKVNVLKHDALRFQVFKHVNQMIHGFGKWCYVEYLAADMAINTDRLNTG